MNSEIKYFIKCLKKILIVAFSILGILIGLKLAKFYIPFLIAFIISLIIEPIIKFLMKKFNFKRKTSSLIVFIIAIGIIIGLLTWGIVTLISEATTLLETLNQYIEKIYHLLLNLLKEVDLKKISASNEFLTTIQNSTNDLLNNVSNWIKTVLKSILNIVSSLPSIGIYIVITFLSLYFICVDKIYMLDRMEHHFPRRWIRKIREFIKEISKNLGNYLRAQAILILIGFLIILIGLYLLKLLKFKIEYPLLVAIAIAFVDALPILGCGTILIPWSIVSALYNDYALSINLLILWIIVIVSRQIIEPKIVSGKIGIHPIFTLISMYTGFKFVGIFGLIIGPIVLIILKTFYSSAIDKGIIKSIIEIE